MAWIPTPSARFGCVRLRGVTNLLNFILSCDKTASFPGHQIAGRLWPLVIYRYLLLAVVDMTHKQLFSRLIDKEEADRPQEQNFTTYAIYLSWEYR